MTKPRGLLEREEVVLLAVILGGIVLLTILFVVFRSTNETVAGSARAAPMVAWTAAN